MSEEATAILAEVWATLDGHRDAFIAERDGIIKQDDAAFEGRFIGYVAEAREVLAVLAEKGWHLTQTNNEQKDIPNAHHLRRS
jgi:hypothetical protein